MCRVATHLNYQYRFKLTYMFYCLPFPVQEEGVLFTCISDFKREEQYSNSVQEKKPQNTRDRKAVVRRVSIFAGKVKYSCPCCHCHKCSDLRVWKSRCLMPLLDRGKGGVQRRHRDPLRAWAQCPPFIPRALASPGHTHLFEKSNFRSGLEHEFDFFQKFRNFS